MQHGTRLAAVDLGSNSFRLEIGRIDHGQFLRTEYLKETVRQGSGLDENRNLSPDAMRRGWECLSRFGERLAGFEPGEVRAVATQTLREARNRDEFLITGNRLLGHPIDVISGREEARLIYLGVTRSLPSDGQRRLVIDIGGRSTELILGAGASAQRLESYRVGSISWSQRYFADLQFSRQAFRMAEIAAKAVLDEAIHLYPPSSWDIAYGSAGTVGAIADELAAAGWGADAIHREGLDWLLDKVIAAQSAEKIRLPGLREDRKAIIGGGLSVLRALFDLLQIDVLRLTQGGLRHGLLWELLGGSDDQADIRVRSIDRLKTKFGVDREHGQRVARVAQSLLSQMLVGDTDLDEPSLDRLHRKVRWAAELHEIGSHISHSDHHKHGAYILENVDAMGFSQSELKTLSQLVLGHRGKLRKLEIDFENRWWVMQLLALRMAVILCHARRDPQTEGLWVAGLGIRERSVTIHCDAKWEQNHPQSAHLLREEVTAWGKTPWMVHLAAQSTANGK
ncbi:MAG: Ppx/GppA family phosphatase [Rhodoferax sp.]|nr:Ppx/GppA family phosphatase [Rhodoferax sp.]